VYSISDGVEESNDAIVQVTVTDAIFTFLSNEGNDRSIAAVLDSACEQLLLLDSGLNQGQTNLRARCLDLRALVESDPSRLASVINQIAPEETIAMMRTASTANQSHSSAVANRLTNIGRGISAFSVNGVTVLSSEDFGGAAGDEEGNSSIAAKLGLFLSLQLESAEKEKTELENGFEQDGSGVTLGLDTRITDAFYVGAAFGYSSNTLEYLNEGGEVDTETTNLIGYALLNQGAWSGDVQLGYAVNNFDINRRITYVSGGNDVVTSAEGTTSGDQIFLQSSLQYALNYKQFSFFPNVRLSYQQNSISAYTENNADGFSVNLGEQDLSRLTFSAGLQAQYAFNFNWGVLLPLAEINIFSDSGDQDEIQGQFSFSPVESDYFILEAEEADSSYAQLGLGLSTVLTHGFSGFFKYEQIVGYENLDSNRVSLGFRYEL